MRETKEKRKKERKKDEKIRTKFVTIFEPISDSIKCITSRDIKNEKDAVCSSVVACCDAPEFLLTSLMKVFQNKFREVCREKGKTVDGEKMQYCVPCLNIDLPTVDLQLAHHKLDADSDVVRQRETLFRELQQHATLTNA